MGLTKRNVPGTPSAPKLPRQRRAFSTIGGPIDTGGDPEEARALEALWNIDRGLARALTHGFHSYAGRLHPSIARGAVERWSQRGQTVVDPFCGSGTVLVEALGLGRRAIGVDASPLAVGIAATRTTPLGEAGRAQLVSEAARIAEESADLARRRRRPEVPAWAKHEFERFHPHVVFELLGLREGVLETSDTPVGRALRFCFSSILVKVMKEGPQAPRDGLDKRIARGIPSRLFADRAEELARGLVALERRIPAGTPPAEVAIGDARHLAGIESGTVALVATSPPYAGTYDYAAHHDVRFAWLGLPRRRFEEAQIGARRTGLGADPAIWRAAQRQILGEIARVLAPGGWAMLVVGDGIVADRPEDASEAIGNAAEPMGLIPVARASQARPTRDRRLEGVFAGQPRREHLLLLRKDAAAPTRRAPSARRGPKPPRRPKPR